MEKLYIQSPETRPEADCDSDHKLLIVKLRLKLKKVGKTTRPFRHNLNQIPFHHTMEMTNRFKGLDLIDRVPKELWKVICNIARGGDKKHPQEKEIQKGKIVVIGGLTNS